MPLDPVTRFAKLPLVKRFAIVEELGCQLQPGGTPEKAAEKTLWHIVSGEPMRRLLELLDKAERP